MGKLLQKRLGVGTGMRLATASAAIAAALLGTLAVTAHAQSDPVSERCADSPSRVLRVCIALEDGAVTYRIDRNGKSAIAPSRLGLSFAGETAPRFRAVGNFETGQADTTWEQPWGEQRLVRDHHTSVSFALNGDTQLTRDLTVAMRIFDDGIGIRYANAGIAADREIRIADDLTEFNPAGTFQAWSYPALGPDRDEYLYTQTDLKRISLAETPLTMKRGDGLHISIHEAALVDFSSMLLAGDGAGGLEAWLMPGPDGVLVRRTGPFHTPWRTIQIGPSAASLADSRILLNLNEPNALGDVSWVEPGKYVGIWWEMHLDRSTWGSGPRHGARTENVLKYIDFAAQNGFAGVLVEGWNRGWDGDWIANGDKFSFTEPYPDFDLARIASYARERGVRLIGHHETGGGVSNYEAQLEEAMELYAAHGVTQVKTGHVKPSGTISDEQGGLHWFADQYMVNHHARVARAAARNGISINAHEPIKDTGLRRTFPNLISREGARGQEFNAWGRPTNPPEHVATLAFTRMLAGPMDFTPGIFDIPRDGAPLTHRVQSTLAKQLALYVVLYSPIQMAADLPENYRANPEPFQFIRDVPTDWEQSVTLQGEIGDLVVVARQQRGSQEWFLGAVTDEEKRTVVQSLAFLRKGTRYEARIYRDGASADFRKNPLALEIESKEVTSSDTLTLELAPGGGAAVRFRPID